jgi:hypothetical protein
MTEYRPPRPRLDPISDVDPLPIALAWRERDTSPLLAAFAEIVRELAVPTGGEPPSDSPPPTRTQGCPSTAIKGTLFEVHTLAASDLTGTPQPA